jgi:hypothetical protein
VLSTFCSLMNLPECCNLFESGKMFEYDGLVFLLFCTVALPLYDVFRLCVSDDP